VKVESRGKYPGVKLHLEPEEVEIILAFTDQPYYEVEAEKAVSLLEKMRKHILKLQEETPGLLQERTPEQIAAILAKEVEKASLQLDRVKKGKDWKKIEPDALKTALLKHVKEK
jgi:hypothetical protein